MLIRYGYEITVWCSQPTAMVTLLSVHDERRGDLRAPERFVTTPQIDTSTYRDLFGAVQPGWARVQAICDFANDQITFNYQNALSTRTAYDAYEQRTGVCRDFAHLAVALCRCMNLPARYVNGYLGDIGVPVVDPMDFSAWMEVYVGGQWRTFDPRNNIPRIGRIVVARGRDAADVAMISSFGPHALNGFRVWTYEAHSADADGPPR